MDGSAKLLILCSSHRTTNTNGTWAFTSFSHSVSFRFILPSVIGHQGAELHTTNLTRVVNLSIGRDEMMNHQISNGLFPTRPSVWPWCVPPFYFFLFPIRCFLLLVGLVGVPQGSGMKRGQARWDWENARTHSRDLGWVLPWVAAFFSLPRL